MAEPNLHATALLLGDRGVLIAGPSGSGKTTLALMLITQFVAADQFARLLADDQVFLHASFGRLMASCPETIAGLAEVHGVGPQPLPYLRRAVIDLVIRLVPEADSPRFADPLTEVIEGIALPRLDLPARNATASCLAITAWLKAPLLA